MNLGLQLLRFIKETITLKKKKNQGDTPFRSSGSGIEELHIIYCGIRSSKHACMLHLDLVLHGRAVASIPHCKGLISKRNLTAWRRVNCSHGRYRVRSRD
jgi:hypothetical protein